LYWWLMSETLRSELLGTAGLSAAALAALLITLRRTPVDSNRTARQRTTLVYAALVLAQALHAAEEHATGFSVAFPSSLGLVPWPASFFLTFNIVWLAVWIAAGIGLRAGHHVAHAPVWFLALAAIANGVAHPLLAIRAGGYFPGLFTSPFLAVGGILLWRCMMEITESRQRGYARDVLLFFETLLFTVLVPGTVTIWLPRDWLRIWGDTSPSPWTIWHIAALVPLTIGFAIYARCVWEFAARGRGIPAPLDHPKQLVVTGLYRYVRNPMYVGVLLVLLGEALFFRSRDFLIYVLIWFAFVNLAVLVYEEPNLRRKFGASYDRYCESVRRWIPGRDYR
jgi:protein-S-isoprenylcysteine O-methyltransferase Ste14